MRNEIDNLVLKELGLATFDNLIQFCRSISSNVKRNIPVTFPHESIENDYGTYITCTSFIQDNNSMKLSKPFTANGFITFSNGQEWSWAIAREEGRGIPHFQSFSQRKSSSAAKTNTAKTKICTCNWSFLHSNNGCKCGAITPYNPNNLFR